MHGGKFLNDLTKKCTHLIVDKPTGKKYHGAVKWGLFTVTKDWFFDSIQKHARQDEETYIICPVGTLPTITLLLIL